MEQRARDLIKYGNKLFDDKLSVDSLWQEIALNFYPERADFTTERTDGEEYATHLYSSYPVMARRELGNMLSAGLRPRSTKWFNIHVDDENVDNGDAERAFLEYLSEVQWRAMYDPNAGLVRATKQTDHDLVTFGNGVIKFGVNQAADGLLFRNYHLRDNAWSENAEGAIDCNHRNWEPTARQLMQHFGEKCSENVKKAAKKEPEKTFKCRHVVVPTRIYDEYKSPNGKQFPFTSLYVELESETVLEELGLNYFCYVIPRWQTVANSVFGVSMATAIILPDGRTMQVVMRTLREAGEKHVDPPMIAVQDAIRSDIALYAGGVTTADIDYDNKVGDVLRPIMRDKSGFPIGVEVAEALKLDIRSGFFLDKLQLPENGKEMTAFEVQRRLEEHMRAQSPIYDPITEDYSNPLCEGVFNVLRDYGAFPLRDMPRTLAGMETKFKFRSPLADLAERNEAEMYVDVMNRIVMPAAQIDPAQLENVDMTEAVRDAMRAAGWKAKWFKPKEAVAQKQMENDQAQKMQEGAAAMGSMGAIAEQGGNAMQALQGAGVDMKKIVGE